VADSYPTQERASAKPFTAYRLRQLAADLGVATNDVQLKDWVQRGLLPEPEVEPWTEETVVPRFLRAHRLKDESWSLDRRVVHLYLERYPVPPEKLRLAMAGMLPTIQAPVRKMARLESAVHSRKRSEAWVTSPKTAARLPEDWRSPHRTAWADVLLKADPDYFANRVGVVQYSAVVMNDPLSGVANELTGIPMVEQLTLLTVRELAARRDLQALVEKMRKADRVGAEASSEGRS